MMRGLVLLAVVAAAQGFSGATRRDLVRSVTGALPLIAAAPAVTLAYQTVEEPTEEWKAGEAKAEAFRKKQRELAKTFNGFAEAFTDAKTDAVASENLESMTKFVYQQGGLPLGITAKQVVNRVRSKKGDMLRDGLWATPTEMAYQGLTAQMRKLSLPL